MTQVEVSEKTSLEPSINPRLQQTEVLPQPEEDWAPREWRALAEAITTPEATTKKLRPELRSLVEKAIARSGDPDRQRKLRICGDILEYQLFGRPDEPPPQGLHFSRNGNAVGMNYDQARDYCHSCHQEMVEEIGTRDLDAIVDGLGLHEHLMSPEVMVAAEQYVKSLPSYKLLKAMGTAPLVEEDTAESSYWRQVKETIIRSDVERRWGVNIDSPTAIQARQEYKRLVHNLDLLDQDEPQARTTKKPSAHTASKERLESLLKSAMDIESTRAVAAIADVGGRKTGSADVYIAIDGVISWFSVRLMDAAARVGGHLGLYSPPYLYGDVFPNQSLLAEAIISILGAHAQNKTYEEGLELAVKNAALTILKGESRERRDLIAVPNYQYRLQPRQAMESTYTVEVAKRHEEYHQHIDGAAKPGSVDFLSLEDILRLEREKIGRIIDSPLRRRLLLDGESRLIQSIGNAPTKEFSTEGAEESLHIRLKRRGFNGCPYIPGYILTSMRFDEKNRRVYGFVRDPESDPYVRPTMRIAEDARLRLADEYEAIGMTVLADAVRNSRYMDVHELSRLVQGATYYPLHFSRSRGKLPDSFTPTSLRDFAPIIKSRRLWAQCNGSAPFLALSLQLCGFEAGVIKGRKLSLALPLVRRIKAAPHAQTYMNHDGRRYIIDATGNLTAFNELKKVAVGAYTRVRDSFTLVKNMPKIVKMIRHAPLATRAPEPIPASMHVQPNPRTKIEIITQTQETRRNISQALSRSLAPMFGARDGDSLITALSRVMDIKTGLTKGDALLRALSASRRAADDNISREEVADLLRYLQNYKDKPSQVKRLRLPQYAPAVLDVLISYTSQLAATFEQ